VVPRIDAVSRQPHTQGRCLTVTGTLVVVEGHIVAAGPLLMLLLPDDVALADYRPRIRPVTLQLEAGEGVRAGGAPV
jgi:hypothetical protein